MQQIQNGFYIDVLSLANDESLDKPYLSINNSFTNLNGVTIHVSNG